MLFGVYPRARTAAAAPDTPSALVPPWVKAGSGALCVVDGALVPPTEPVVWVGWVLVEDVKMYPADSGPAGGEVHH